MLELSRQGFSLKERSEVREIMMSWSCNTWGFFFEEEGKQEDELASPGGTWPWKEFIDTVVLKHCDILESTRYLSLRPYYHLVLSSHWGNFVVKEMLLTYLFSTLFSKQL